MLYTRISEVARSIGAMSMQQSRISCLAMSRKPIRVSTSLQFHQHTKGDEPAKEMQYLLVQSKLLLSLWANSTRCCRLILQPRMLLQSIIVNRARKKFSDWILFLPGTFIPLADAVARPPAPVPAPVRGPVPAPPPLFPLTTSVKEAALLIVWSGEAVMLPVSVAQDVDEPTV